MQVYFVVLESSIPLNYPFIWKIIRLKLSKLKRFLPTCGGNLFAICNLTEYRRDKLECYHITCLILGKTLLERIYRGLEGLERDSGT